MSSFDAAWLARIDEIVADAVAQGQVPGAVVGVACGDEEHVTWAGTIALDGGAPMARDTLFRIASITKPMTAAAVLSLAEDGAFGLDEPVDRLLPELTDRRVLRRPDGPLADTVPAERQPTIRELLTFTWGFGMQGAMFVAPQQWPVHAATDQRELFTIGEPAPARMPDPDTWIARLGELPLLVQPGTKWLYQTGSQVLGVLAARAVGAGFADVVGERVLGPLGMADTGFHASDVDRLATYYHSVGGTLSVADPPDGQWSCPPAFADGSGGLVSSVDDVLAFGRMLLRGGAGVLRAETVAEATRDQLTAAQRRNDWPGFDILLGRGWGYGMSVLDDGRYSWDGGFGTAWSNLPALDLTVVVLTQRGWDESGPPPVCAAVLAAARAAVG